MYTNMFLSERVFDVLCDTKVPCKLKNFFHLYNVKTGDVV